MTPQKNQVVKTVYGELVTVLDVRDNVVYTTGGIYHITKIFDLTGKGFQAQ